MLFSKRFRLFPLFMYRLILSALLFVPIKSMSQCNINPETQQPIKIIFFVPETVQSNFWGMNVSYAVAAAKSLGIDLEIDIIEPEYRNRFFITDRMMDKLTRGPKPDYVIGAFFYRGEVRMLEKLEELGIKFFSINTSLPGKKKLHFGLPRQQYASWVGHMSPDDVKAGYDLAVSLHHINKKYQTGMIGLSGDIAGQVSSNRVEGLMQAVDSFDINLYQVFPSNWDPSVSAGIYEVSKSRFGNVNAIWTITDSLVPGIIKKIEQTSQVPGKDIHIGTMDWSVNAINLLLENKINVSYGGHFMETGRALVLLLDHFNGIDFTQELGLEIKTQLRALTPKNVSLYADRLLEKNWQGIDFKLLSKCFNTNRKHYDFDMKVLTE